MFDPERLEEVSHGKSHLVLLYPGVDGIDQQLISACNAQDMLHFGVLPPFGRCIHCFRIGSPLPACHIIFRPRSASVRTDNIFVPAALRAWPICPEGRPRSNKHKRFELFSIRKVQFWKFAVWMHYVRQDGQAHVSSSGISSKNNLRCRSLQLVHHEVDRFDRLNNLGRVSRMRYQRVLDKEECDRRRTFFEGGVDPMPEFEMRVFPIKGESSTCMCLSQSFLGTRSGQLLPW